MDNNVYRIEDSLSGETQVLKLIERSKDKDIIYRTDDVVLSTDSVKAIAYYVESLIKENEILKRKDYFISGMRGGKELLNKYIYDSVLKDDVRELIRDLEENGWWYFLHERDAEICIKKLKERLGV